MLALRREELREQLDQLRAIRAAIPDPEEIRRRPGRIVRTGELIGDFLVCWMDVVNHLVSRFDRSTPTAHRDRVRFLGRLGLFPESFVETHLVPMTAHYENWAGLRSSVEEETIVTFLRRHGSALKRLLDHLERFLEDPEQHGFTLSEG